ncbi:hypothetical protein MTBLM5_20029 [Magnetospirillum sp. LM-5]|nr:hypothetical protein MTBLM5_20029 [Magnetospirillum sp. LM-5]
MERPAAAGGAAGGIGGAVVRPAGQSAIAAGQSDRRPSDRHHPGPAAGCLAAPQLLDHGVGGRAGHRHSGTGAPDPSAGGGRPDRGDDGPSRLGLPVDPGAGRHRGPGVAGPGDPPFAAAGGLSAAGRPIGLSGEKPCTASGRLWFLGGVFVRLPSDARTRDPTDRLSRRRRLRGRPGPGTGRCRHLAPARPAGPDRRAGHRRRLGGQYLA